MTAHRFNQLARIGLFGCCLQCSKLVDFDGYRVAQFGAQPDGGGGSTLPSVALRSFWFERGPGSFAVSSGDGLLAGRPTDHASLVLAGTFPTASGGSVDVDASGGFVYFPPGTPGSFWGDDGFDYALAATPGPRHRVRLTVQPGTLMLAELAASSGAGFGVSGAEPGDAVALERLAAAGDVNGDGFEDFVIGAGGGFASVPFDVPYTQGRAVYVIFGGPNANSPLSLAQLPGEPARGFQILGDENDDSFDAFGFVVAGAGDVNGDGFDDLIISSHGTSPEGTGASLANARGGAYVVFGKPDAEPVRSTEILAGRGGGFVILPPDDYRLTGIDVAGAGDVNGDGLADVVLGVPFFGFESSESSSAVQVVFGKLGVEPVYLEEVMAGRGGGFAILAGSQDTTMGLYVAGVGDVNGDGLSDVVAGSPGYPDPYLQVGRDAVVFGKSDLAPVLLDELGQSPERGFFILGADPGDFLGLSAAGGDINGDGLDDIVVASSQGSLGPPPAVDVPISAVDGAGASDAGAGDAGAVDAGGPVAEPTVPTVQARGMVYVVFGKRTPGDVAVRDLENADGAASGFAIAGVEDSQALGRSISAGDINGDGLGDIIAAGTPRTGMAATCVVFGKRDTKLVLLPVSGVDPSLGLAIVPPGGERAGTPVASGADFNGDGLDDLLLGASGYAAAPQAAGGAYVVYGWDMSQALAGREHALLGRYGDDTFELPETPVVIVRGGNGTDTLRVGSGTASLDLTTPGRYQSIEVIDARGRGPQEIVLDETALRRIPQNQPGSAFALVRRLTILGDAEDSLRFDRTGFVDRGVNRGRRVLAREGAHYGLEVSPELIP